MACLNGNVKRRIIALLSKVGMDLGLAPRPLGVGATFALGLAPVHELRGSCPARGRLLLAVARAEAIALTLPDSKRGGSAARELRSLASRIRVGGASGAARCR